MERIVIRKQIYCNDKLKNVLYVQRNLEVKASGKLILLVLLANFVKKILQQRPRTRKSFKRFTLNGLDFFYVFNKIYYSKKCKKIFSIKENVGSLTTSLILTQSPMTDGVTITLCHKVIAKRLFAIFSIGLGTLAKFV